MLIKKINQNDISICVNQEEFLLTLNRENSLNKSQWDYFFK